MIENVIYYTACYLLALFAQLGEEKSQKTIFNAAVVIAIPAVALFMFVQQIELVKFLDVRYAWSWAGDQMYPSRRTADGIIIGLIFATFAYFYILQGLIRSIWSPITRR